MSIIPSQKLTNKILLVGWVASIRSGSIMIDWAVIWEIEGEAHERSIENPIVALGNRVQKIIGVLPRDIAFNITIALTRTLESNTVGKSPSGIEGRKIKAIKIIAFWVSNSGISNYKTSMTVNRYQIIEIWGRVVARSILICHSIRTIMQNIYSRRGNSWGSLH